MICETKKISIKSFVKKTAYAISANFLNLIIAFLSTFVIPRFLGNRLEQYGYLQIYIFYVSYLGFFHFGWCDGIFLRDGGKEYSSLDKSLYSSQFWIFTVLELIISLSLFAFGFLLAANEEYLFIWETVSLNVILLLPRTMLGYYLQTTNRIKEYASIISIGLLVYGLSIFFTIILLSKDYKWFIFGDLLGKMFSLVVSVFWCKDIVFTKPAKLQFGFSEGLKNISVGSKLLCANIASLLITGIARWGIQQQWDISTYGLVSMVLNVSNVLLVFISAVALVLFPTLRRIDKSKLIKIYDVLRNAVMIPLLGMMILYYPIKQILLLWLPQYGNGLQYLGILLPICIYAAKMSLLIQTYMNVYRLEKKLLIVNLFGVGIAIATTLFSVFYMKSIPLTMLSIIINQMFRCIVAEFVLANVLKINVVKDVFLEVVLTLLFILVNWYIDGWLGTSIYAMVFLIYIMIKKKDIIVVRQYVKLIKN